MPELIDDAGAERSGTAHQVFTRVLDLQRSWSKNNTPEMSERGQLIRRSGPDLIRGWLEDRQHPGMPFELSVEGRDGTGLKTKVPWIRVFSPLHSPRATEGWYVVYLFAADGSAMYLTLGQGATTPEGGQFKLKDAGVLAEGNEWARALLKDALHEVDDIAVDGRIDLADPGLGSGYEQGTVVATRYERPLPADDRLARDLERYLALLGIVYAEAPPVPALYDAKYKIVGSGPSRADLYQMVAYCDRLGLAEATLVFPNPVEVRTIGIGDRKIHVIGMGQMESQLRAVG